MKLYKLIFLSSMLLGTIITVSSYSWFSMWIGLEINLLSIIPLFCSKKSSTSSEASMKYFITQAMASLVLLMSVIMLLILNEFITPQMNFYLMMMMNSALLTKLGAAPFHFWFPEVVEGLNWTNCFILLTWQKIAPITMLMNFKMNEKFTTTIIMLSLIVSTVMAFNQTSLRKIMAFSSISHIAWMLASLMVSASAWMIYFFIYSFMNIVIVMMFKMSNCFYMKQILSMMSNNKLMKMTFMMNFMSLGGLPPLIGFLPKWIVVNWMISNSMYFLAFFMIMFSLIMLFTYIRMSLPFLVMNLSSQKLETMNKKNNFILFLNLYVMLGLILCTMVFNLT